eukprot:350542-Chlamydomonas_euryale.AAC.1
MPCAPSTIHACTIHPYVHADGTACARMMTDSLPLLVGLRALGDSLPVLVGPCALGDSLPVLVGLCRVTGSSTCRAWRSLGGRYVPGAAQQLLTPARRSSLVRQRM